MINAATGFDFEVSPGSLTVAKGAPGKATVVISPLNGFTVRFSSPVRICLPASRAISRRARHDQRAAANSMLRCVMPRQLRATETNRSTRSLAASMEMPARVTARPACRQKGFSAESVPHVTLLAPRLGVRAAVPRATCRARAIGNAAFPWRHGLAGKRETRRVRSFRRGVAHRALATLSSAAPAPRVIPTQPRS